MSEKWVAYDAISGDVLADGQERQIRRYLDQTEEATEGQHAIVIAREADWPRAVEGVRRSMSGNPPRRNPAGIEHL